MSQSPTEPRCLETHVPRLRPRVLWAIARRDILRVRGGQQHKGRLRSIGVAGLLLGAAALVPGPGGPPEAGAPTVPAVVVVGALPSALDGKVRAVPQSPVTLHTMDGQPVRVVARGVGPRLRAALDELPGPTVRRAVVGQAPSGVGHHAEQGQHGGRGGEAARGSVAGDGGEQGLGARPGLVCRYGWPPRGPR